MVEFAKALAFVLKNEGGFSQNPNDKGGTTNCGISMRFLKNLSADQLKKYNIFGEIDDELIRSLSSEQIKNIYYDFFWREADFEKILNQDVANYIFDMAVNMGIAPAIKCTQRAIWSVMKARSLTDDGIMGEKTIGDIQRCGFMILPALRSERAGYYRLIATMHDDMNNLNGWLNRAYESK